MEQDENRTYEGQNRLSMASFLIELPGFVLLAASMLATGSLIVIADFVDSFCIILREGFTILLSRKLRQNLKFEYNYGKGKIEAIAALFCDVLLMAGLLIVALGAVRQLFVPEAPSEALFWTILLKVFNVACDGVFVWLQRRLYKQSGSMLVEAEYRECVRALVFDVYVLAALVLCYALRAYRLSWYLTPVGSLVLVAVFSWQAVCTFRLSLTVLTDKTLPEDQQMLILKELNSMYDKYEELVAINSHLVGDTPVIELRVKFAPETTCAQMRQFKEAISQKLGAQLEGAVVTLTVE